MLRSNAIKNACAALCFCAALAMTGCGNKHVEYLDNDDVEVVTAEIAGEDGEFLVARLAFKIDDGSDRIHSVYRVEWYDDDENVLETSAWRPLVMRGNVVEKVTERSTVPGATHFKVFLSNVEK